MRGDECQNTVASFFTGFDILFVVVVVAFVVVAFFFIKEVGGWCVREYGIRKFYSIRP